MSEHTTSYKVEGKRTRVTKKAYASQIEAEERAAWWQHESGRDLSDLQAYHCRVCRAWHLGRKGTKVYWWDFMTPEEYELYKARLRIYWVLWRLAHGRPITIHSQLNRKRIAKLKHRP